MKQILLLFFCSLAFSCTNSEKKERLAIQKAMKEYETLVAQKVQDIENKSSGQKVDEQMVFFGNDSLRIVSLKQLIEEKSPLFFYFSESTCSPCIEKCVMIMKAYIPDYSSNKILVFVSPDYLSRFRENCYGKRLLNLSNGKLGIPVENEMVPFFFTLGDDMKIENLHVVNKENFGQTEKYIKSITKK
ncbi:MAG: hypothetical protein LBJ17_06570 [Dysgonamonadaceae bacterium]|jgi:hypothetical protein|nr:hypothetical protein [Dysgonamonadaceae bacterium]